MPNNPEEDLYNLSVQTTAFVIELATKANLSPELKDKMKNLVDLMMSISSKYADEN